MRNILGHCGKNNSSIVRYDGGRDSDLNLDPLSPLGGHRTLISLSYLEDYVICLSKMASIRDTVDDKR